MTTILPDEKSLLRAGIDGDLIPGLIHLHGYTETHDGANYATGREMFAVIVRRLATSKRKVKTSASMADLLALVRSNLRLPADQWTTTSGRACPSLLTPKQWAKFFKVRCGFILAGDLADHAADLRLAADRAHRAKILYLLNQAEADWTADSVWTAFQAAKEYFTTAADAPGASCTPQGDVISPEADDSPGDNYTATECADFAAEAEESAKELWRTALTVIPARLKSWANGLRLAGYAIEVTDEASHACTESKTFYVSNNLLPADMRVA